MTLRNIGQESSVPHIASLLASLLVCYPEIAAINLEPKTNVVKFIFYLTNITKEKLDAFGKILEQSLYTYYFLEKKEVEVYSFSYQALDIYTTIEIQRDVQSITEKEAALMIAVLQEELGSFLVTEEDNDLVIDDFSLHEELIDYLLANAKKTSSNIKLIALRDEGKVLVFNK